MCVFESVGVCNSSGPLAWAATVREKALNRNESEKRDFFMRTTEERCRPGTCKIIT